MRMRQLSRELHPLRSARGEPGVQDRPLRCGVTAALYPMRKVIITVSILLICAALTACRIDATAILNAEDSLILYVHSTGSAAIKTDIPKDSQRYSDFREWFLKNEKGWSPSPVTYVPSIEVRGKKFSINFLHGSAIINFQDTNGSYHQYVKDVKPQEYQFLRK